MEGTWTHQKSNDRTEGAKNTRAKNFLFSFTPLHCLSHTKYSCTSPWQERFASFHALFTPLRKTLPLLWLFTSSPSLKIAQFPSLSLMLSLATWASEFPLDLKSGLWFAWINSLWVQTWNFKKMGPQNYVATMSLVESRTALGTKAILALNIIALHYIELFWIE